MNTLTQTWSDWQKLQQAIQTLDIGWKAKGLVPVKVQVHREKLDAEALRQRLPTIAASQGWVIQPSHLRILRQPSHLHILRCSEDQLLEQPVMQAEGIHATDHWQLHHLGRNQWSWTSIQLTETTPTETTPTDATHLAEAITFLAEEKAIGKLAYQRLWRVSPQSHDKPCIELAVFTGFQGA